MECQNMPFAGAASSEGTRMKRRVLIILFCCLAFIAIAFRVPFSPLFAVKQPEGLKYMEPLLYGGDIAIVSRFAYRNALPAIGDLIVFWGPYKDVQYIGLTTPCATGTDSTSGFFAEWFAASPDTESVCFRHVDAETPPHPSLNPVPFTAVKGRVVFILWPSPSWGRVKSG